MGQSFTCGVKRLEVGVAGGAAEDGRSSGAILYFLVTFTLSGKVTPSMICWYVSRHIY